ncbi:hypothetical protein CCMA1212_008287 [Trichoderma ghanense]|uniref:Uncharacterized protein n=1 Tax=Trichoderma ghanense TaxID=65468 RepID=A0ABY2GX90_9HYPO
MTISIEKVVHPEAAAPAGGVVRLAAPAAVPDAVEPVEVALGPVAEGGGLEGGRGRVGDDEGGLALAGDAAAGLGVCAVRPLLGGVAADEVVYQELAHVLAVGFGG